MRSILTELSQIKSDHDLNLARRKLGGRSNLEVCAITEDWPHKRERLQRKILLLFVRD